MKYFFIFLCVLSVTACRHSMRGSGNIKTENRTVKSFTEVSVAGPINVQIKKGGRPSVSVEADDNIIPLVITNVSGNKLSIRLDEISNLNNATVNVMVVITDFTGASASAGAEINADETISNAEKINFTASSAAKITMNIDAPFADAGSSSGAEIKLSGRTKTFSARASSGARVDAENLKAETAKADASSGASINIFASVAVDASASSGAQVNYSGGAASVVKNASSGGDVKQVN